MEGEHKGTEYARKGKEKYGLGKEIADKYKELLALPLYCVKNILNSGMKYFS